MFTTCPHCGFPVALTPTADGAPMHCPRCGGAVPTGGVADQTDTSNPTAGAEAAPTVEAPAIETPSAAPPATPPPSAPFGRTPRKRHAPSFAQTRAAAGKRASGWKWYAGIAGLASLLALQLLLAQRAELAGNARWRPLLAGLCGVLQCDLPPWREPQAFSMLSRNVQPAPGVAGTLEVTASFRNDARWPQPWPTLLVSLSDVDGRQVGLRAFAPREYRGEGKPDDLLEPGQSAAVRFEVLEPAAHIVAFSIEFR